MFVKNEPMSDNFNPSLPSKKRPTFLIVLLILTTISLLGTFAFGIVPLFKGPMSEEQLIKKEVEIAKSKKELETLYKDEESRQAMSDILDDQFAELVYVQTKAFMMHHLFQLLIFVLGALGVYYMYRLNKLGFHFYIIYSLVSVGSVYLIFPPELISSLKVIIALLLSGVFVWLFAMNLKHFDQSDETDSSYKYNN